MTEPRSMTYTYVRMTTEEAEAREKEAAWGAIVCWRSYNPDDAPTCTALLDHLRDGTMTGRAASMALFDIQYARANGIRKDKDNEHAK